MIESGKMESDKITSQVQEVQETLSDIMRQLLDLKEKVDRLPEEVKKEIDNRYVLKRKLNCVVAAAGALDHIDADVVHYKQFLESFHNPSERQVDGTPPEMGLEQYGIKEVIE